MKKGWAATPLTNVCTLFTDGDWVETKDQSPDGIRLIQTGNVGEGSFKNRLEKARYISESTFDDLKCTEILEGDCLVSRLPDPVGRSCLIPETGKKMITAVDCTIIRFKADVTLPEFFNYFSQSRSYLAAVDGHSTGATRRRISRRNLGKVLIPTPPLPEQERIVAILDEAFAVIATATANAEKNITNARKLFENYLSNLSYEKQPLGSFVDIQTGKLNANAAVDGGPYPFFTCSREVSEIDNYAFDFEAVLLAGNNASGDFNVKYFNGRFNAYQRTYVITIKADAQLLYRFLYFQLVRSLKELKMSSVGVGTKFLKLGMIQELMISIPPLEEQQKLLKTLERLISDTEHLESLYQQKLTSLTELKKSILHKAFTGELTSDRSAAGRTLTEAAV